MLRVVRLMMLALMAFTLTASYVTAAPQAKSDKEIADAKARGLVWVNTESKVYHKEGRYYGNTKQGQFMTEADAQKGGYRESKQEIGVKGSKAVPKTAAKATPAVPAATPAAAAPTVAAAPASTADEVKTTTKRSRKKVEQATDTKADTSTDETTKTKRKRKKKTEEDDGGK